MDSIMKIYLGIVIMLCMTAISIGILSMFISVVHVQNLFDEVIGRLSFSDLDAELLEASMKELETEGIQTRFTLYDSNGEVNSYTESEMLPVDTEGIDLVKVEIQYPYKIGEWTSGKTLKLAGYAW